MITATFTAFRNNAASYFNKVEKGETVEIFRKGKPVAFLSPALRDAKSNQAYWKTVKPLFKLKGIKSSELMAASRHREFL